MTRQLQLVIEAALYLRLKLYPAKVFRISIISTTELGFDHSFLLTTLPTLKLLTTNFKKGSKQKKPEPEPAQELTSHKMWTIPA
jgi:hypothetical protein